MPRSAPSTNWDDSWNNSHGHDSGGSNWDGWDVPNPGRVFPWKAILLVLVVGSTAVGGLALVARATQGPEDGARRYLQALAEFDGNDLARNTCTAYQEELLQTGALLSAGGIILQTYTGIELENFEVDISDVTFRTVASTSDTAEVEVGGQMYVSLMLMSMPAPLNESWLMTREGGRWKWCGYARLPAMPTWPPPGDP